MSEHILISSVALEGLHLLQDGQDWRPSSLLRLIPLHKKF